MQPLDEIQRRLENEQNCKIAGAAGTGKTELIVRLHEIYGSELCYVAYSGQAARMLQNRGVPATTIHKLIYYPMDKKRAVIRQVMAEIDSLKPTSKKLPALKTKLKRLHQPGFVLNEELALLGALGCVVDEATMVSEAIATDILSFGKPVLAFGDPYQLPPPFGKSFFDLNTPDVELTQIYRQEAGSGIINLATAVREERNRTDDEPLGNDVLIKPRRRFKRIDKALVRADRIICSTNAIRRDVNRMLLEFHGLGALPKGDQKERLICLQNRKSGLLNGMPVRLSEISYTREKWFLARVHADDGGWNDYGVHRIYRGHFDATAKKWNSSAAKYHHDRDKLLIDEESLLEIDWAFCTTVHKAQGSEWPSVAMITSPWPDRDEDPLFWRQWTYTAITRAASHLTVIKEWHRP